MVQRMVKKFQAIGWEVTFYHDVFMRKHIVRDLTKRVLKTDITKKNYNAIFFVVVVGTIFTKQDRTKAIDKIGTDNGINKIF